MHGRRSVCMWLQLHAQEARIPFMLSWCSSSSRSASAGGNLPLTASALVCAGDEQRLMALLRERGSTALLNAALRRVPIIQMLALLDVLPRERQPDGSQRGGGSSRSRRGSSSRSDESSSNDGSGSDSCTSESSSSVNSSRLRPNLATARILLERLPASELHWELDAALDKLLAAGLQPHYHVFLPWATLHANVSCGIVCAVCCWGCSAGALVLMLPTRQAWPLCACPARAPLVWSATLRAAGCRHASWGPPMFVAMPQAGRPQAVRKVMQRVEQHQGELAPHYYSQLIKARARGAAAMSACLVSGSLSAGCTAGELFKNCMWQGWLAGCSLQATPVG